MGVELDTLWPAGTLDTLCGRCVLMRVGWLGWPVGAIGPQYQMVWSVHALGAWFEGMRAHHAGEGLKVAPRGEIYSSEAFYT